MSASAGSAGAAGASASSARKSSAKDAVRPEHPLLAREGGHVRPGVEARVDRNARDAPPARGAQREKPSEA